MSPTSHGGAKNWWLTGRHWLISERTPPFSDCCVQNNHPRHMLVTRFLNFLVDPNTLSNNGRGLCVTSRNICRGFCVWEASGRRVARLAECLQVEPPPNNEEELRCAASSKVAKCGGELAPLVCRGHCAASAQRGEMRSVTRMPRPHTLTELIPNQFSRTYTMKHRATCQCEPPENQPIKANSPERHDTSQQQVRIA